MKFQHKTQNCSIVPVNSFKVQEVPHYGISVFKYTGDNIPAYGKVEPPFHLVNPSKYPYKIVLTTRISYDGINEPIIYKTSILNHCLTIKESVDEWYRRAFVDLYENDWLEKDASICLYLNGKEAANNQIDFFGPLTYYEYEQHLRSMQYIKE